MLLDVRVKPSASPSVWYCGLVVDCPVGGWGAETVLGLIVRTEERLLSFVLVGEVGMLVMSVVGAEGLRRACCTGPRGPDSAPGGRVEKWPWPCSAVLEDATGELGYVAWADLGV